MKGARKDVLIVTPGLHDIGGVASYYKTILPLLENSYYSVGFLEIGSTKGEGNFFYPVSDQFDFCKRIRETRPILIHINPSLNPKSFIRDGLLVYQAVRRKIPVIVFFHGWDMVFAKRVEKHYLWFFKETFGKACAFIVLASEFKEKLLSWKMEAPIFIEKTPVDVTLLDSFDIEKKVAAILGKQIIQILFLARIEREKGVFETVKAVQLLYNKGIPVSLSIAGDGSAKHDLELYVKQLHLPAGTIKFLGYVKGNEKKYVFTKHDIYCFPTYSEGLPISVLEALAFGMPTITCAVGGLEDLFQDGEMGALVPPRDHVTIAEKIKEMIADRASMVRMARHNHAFAKENFNASTVAARLLDIYRQIITT